MKKKLNGWGKVFGFTASQLLKSRAFMVSTILIGMVIFGGMILIHYLSAKPKDTININNIILQDESGFSNVDYSLIREMDKRCSSIQVSHAKNKSDEELIQQAYQTGKHSVGVTILKTKESFQIKVLIPKESEVTKKEGKELSKVLSTAFNRFKFSNAGLTKEQMEIYIGLIDTQIIREDTGESSMAKMMISMFAPMFFGLLLYFMIIAYGQSIAKNIMSEKSSRILELMLVSVREDALIMGKLFAIIMGAMLQVLIWVGFAVAGNKIGVMLGKSLDKGYKSELNVIVSIIKDSGTDTALTPLAFILAGITIFAGFTLYGSLAAMAGAMVSKAEDLSSSMMFYQYTLVVGFFIPYFAQLKEDSTFIMIGRYLPICAPFSIPADVLVGNISIGEALISVGILLITIAVVVLLTGKVYRSMVLYHGSKLKINELLKIMRG